MKRDARNAIAAWARWGVRNASRFTYSQGPERMSAIGRRGVVPVVADCSAAVTLWYNFAGAPDPNGLGYDREGYTGTLLSAERGKMTDLSLVRPGDIIVYGPGTGWHTALVVESDGVNPLTVSMGRQGDPSFVYVNSDGREPQRYRTFPTLARHVYWPRGFSARPSHDQVRRAGLVGLRSPEEAHVATVNGWGLYRWDGWWFAPSDLPSGIGVQEYAVAAFDTRKN